MNQVLLYSVGADCIDLSSGNVCQDLGFNQCEADTIMLSFYVALRASGYYDPVVIDATDTDVYIQAAAISHDVPGVICIKKKDELLFCRGMCTNEDIPKCLIQFHVNFKLLLGIIWCRIFIIFKDFLAENVDNA